MKLDITQDVSHKTNKEYTVVLVQFEPEKEV